MDKKVLGLILFFALFALGFIMVGCKQEKIKFYRESAASDFLNSLNRNQRTAPVNSGIIDLRDDNSKQTIKFGPSDLNFDMQIKFK